jgi:hypothetical protein
VWVSRRRCSNQEVQDPRYKVKRSGWAVSQSRAPVPASRACTRPLSPASPRRDVVRHSCALVDVQCANERFLPPLCITLKGVMRAQESTAVQMSWLDSASVIFTYFNILQSEFPTINSHTAMNIPVPSISGVQVFPLM